MYNDWNIKDGMPLWYLFIITQKCIKPVMYQTHLKYMYYNSDVSVFYKWGSNRRQRDWQTADAGKLIEADWRIYASVV